MALAHWTSPRPEAAQSHGSPPSFLRCLPTALFCLHCTFFWPVQMCVFSVWSLVCVARLVIRCSLSLSSPLSFCLCLWLHPAKAMGAVLVKSFVYPIRMMKRPFISTLPPARRWQELYLDKPLKHTAQHETAPSKEVRRRYTQSLTNTQYFLHNWVWAGGGGGKERKTETLCKLLSCNLCTHF